MFLLMILRGSCRARLGRGRGRGRIRRAAKGRADEGADDGEAGWEALPLRKASRYAARRTDFERVRDAADTWGISLPLNWHSNCNVAHKTNCDKETNDSGGREKLHSECVRVSAGATIRCMSIVPRISREVENSQEWEGFKVLRKLLVLKQSL